MIQVILPQYTKSPCLLLFFSNILCLNYVKICLRSLCHKTQKIQFLPLKHMSYCPPYWPLLRKDRKFFDPSSGGMDFFDPWSVGGPRFFLFLLWDFFPQNAKNYLFCMFLVVFDQYSEGGQAFFWPRVRVAGYIWPLVRGGRDFFRPLVRGAGLDVRPRPGKNSAPLDVNSGASLMSTEWAFPTKDMCWKFRTNFVVHSCFMEISNILLNKPQVTLGFVRGGDFTQPLKSKSTPS